MSWGTCYSGSNNIHFDFPPIMADGRNYADWLPGAAINQQIRQQNDIQSNWDYRQFLTYNADQIIRQNQLEACNQCCSCPERFVNQTQTQTSNNPYLYHSCFDSTQPFGYENSDLKNIYLSDYQLQARLVTPVFTQYELLKDNFPNFN